MDTNHVSKIISSCILVISIITFFVILTMYIMGTYSLGLLLEDTFFVVLTIIAVLLLPKAEKHFQLKQSEILRTNIYVFLFGLLIVGNVYDVIANTVWFDKALHFMSGIFLTAIGILFAKKWVASGDEKILGYIGFMYSVTVALLWEMIEFLGDIFMSIVFPTYTFRLQAFHLNEAIWILPQPHGLADTMVDVTLGILGAFIYMLFFRYSNNTNK